jgi:uncharacterized membrane protein YhaH (DUF805 family)
MSLLVGRLHDIDHSGWWSLPILLPIAVAYAVADSPKLERLPKEYGYVAVALVFASIAAALYVGFKRGTQGPNRFGRDPLVKPIPP